MPAPEVMVRLIAGPAGQGGIVMGMVGAAVLRMLLLQ